MQLDRSRVIPLAILVAFAIVYATIRAWLAAIVWRLDVFEVPIAILVATPLLWLAARPHARPAPKSEPVWRKHEQVVRVVPDPEAQALAAELRANAEKASSSPRKRDAYLQRIIVDHGKNGGV